MRARVYRYRVPWRRPPDPAYGAFREGLFIRVDEAFAECSPLPALEPMPLDAHVEALLRWARGETGPLPHAARFAIEAVSFDPIEAVVPVAALLPRGHDPAELPVRASAVKVKVGELSVVARVRDRFPDAEIRVDVNRAWTIEEAERAWEVLAPLGVSFVEEPLRDPVGLSSLSFPVALDETLREQPELVAAPWLHTAVFKPELGPHPVEKARRAIVSACYPTDLGLWALGAFAHRKGLTGAQGLGTLRFLDTSEIYETPLLRTDDGFSLAVQPVPRWSALEELA